MVSHWQESTIEFGQAVDSRFRPLLVSGIARKHGIVPKLFLECPQYFPHPQKTIFFQEQEIFWEWEFVASQFGDYKKMFLIVPSYLEGQSLCYPHLTPQIQCLPDRHINPVWAG
jgi:hypothetical protein